jgi:hypothetical protein
MKHMDNQNSRMECGSVTGIDELLAEIAAKRNARYDPCVIQPGSQHAAAATKAGLEDEYSNRMTYRFGGEW